MNGVGRGEEKQERKKGAFLTRETVGMTLLLFSAVMFLIVVTGRLMFGDVGVAITSFFVGLAGFFVYPLLVLVIYYSAVLVFGKKWIPARWIARVFLLLLAVFFVVHTATAERFFGSGYGAYLGGCWSAASERAGDGTGGGVLLGLIAYPARALLSEAGAYVLFSICIALALYFFLMGTPLRRLLHPAARRREQDEPKTADKSPAPVAFGDLPVPERTPALGEERSSGSVSAPAPAQPSVQPSAQPPVYPAATEEDLRSDSYARSRAILFQGDPASSYRNNLIFDRDSRFNVYPRRSTVGPVSGTAPASVPAASAPPAAPSVPSYTERYLSQTETSRPAMPRRVTEERPAPRSLTPDEDFNYPQAPSYHAPSEPVREERDEHDFYAHDVSFEGMSSAPNVNDGDEPAPPVRRNPAPAQPFAAAPAAGPAPSVPAPVEQENGTNPSADTSAAKEREFRSLFSRPVEERTRISEDALPEQPAESRFSRGEEQPAESRFSRGEEQPAESRFSRGEEQPAESRFSRGADVPETPDGAPADETDLSEDGRVFEARVRGSAADLFDGDEEIDDSDYRAEDGISSVPEVPSRAERRLSGRGGESRLQDVQDEPAPVPQKHKYKAYVYPSLDDLDDYNDGVHISQEEIEQNSAVIVDTLAGFRVDAEVVKVTVGATVTRYDIDIPRNIAVSQVIKRDTEIAMRLHVRDGVNIYSNSEAGAISIEVPNSVRATVGLKSVMQADEYVNAKPNSLMFAIGEDVEGRNVCGNIVKMTHVLVAGSTNSGKSVCLDSMLISLICKYSPEELRLILIDPKKTEFIVFDGLPHLMINEIISDAQKAVMALNWAIKEMDRRYDLFEKKTRSGVNVRNIDEYNRALTEDEERLPKIVIVVDELADLMSVAKKDIEERIQRLTQKSRAAGIHMVLATQRPSVDVITGVIKGNLPTRMALRVISDVDSRTILDEAGAQKLLGNGDMLFRTGGMFDSLRVQGAFVSSEEMQRVVEDVKANNEAYFDESVADFINRTESSDGAGDGADMDDGAVDPQYIKALAIVVKLGTASISLIQRKCSVGYNHAGKIIEWMELMGYISAFDGKAKARTVLLSKEDFEAKYGDLD